MDRNVTCYIALLLTIALVTSADADMVTILPFQGEWTETWESFQNTMGNEDLQLANPTSILNDEAAISNPQMEILEYPGWTFVLGSSGAAQPSDGVKAMLLVGFNATAVIHFNSPVSEFGAFWGAATSAAVGDPALISLTFFDEANEEISSLIFPYSRSSQGDGLLEWHGWSSTTPIQRITYTGHYVVTDGLQANLVPEPAAALLLALAAMTLRARRQRRRS